MKLAIFDFDGTLVDSRKLIIESHRVVFGEFGFTIPSEDESLSLIGMSLELVLLQLAGPDAPVDKMVATYQRLLPLLRADAAYLRESVLVIGGSDFSGQDGKTKAPLSRLKICSISYLRPGRCFILSFLRGRPVVRPLTPS